MKGNQILSIAGNVPKLFYLMLMVKTFEPVVYLARNRSLMIVSVPKGLQTTFKGYAFVCVCCVHCVCWFNEIKPIQVFE